MAGFLLEEIWRSKNQNMSAGSGGGWANDCRSRKSDRLAHCQKPPELALRMKDVFSGELCNFG
jgi:hypothetical protein